MYLQTSTYRFACITLSLMTILSGVVFVVFTTWYLTEKVQLMEEHEHYSHGYFHQANEDGNTEYIVPDFQVPEGFCFDNIIEDVSWVKTEDEMGFTTRFKELDGVDIKQYLDETSEVGTRGSDDDREPVDCFGLPSFLAKTFRWMFKPQSKEKIDTRFYLYTRTNPYNGVQISTEPDLARKIYNVYRSNRQTVLIIHGFMSNSEQFWVKDLTDALLKRNDVNVIVVDWSGGSMSWKYWRAVANTRIVAREINFLCRRLIQLTGTSRSQIYMIGHSLGAHIAAFTAKHLGTIGRITGLDPAEPCFKSQSNTITGLNASDALFVDVIHTNMGLLNKLGFGLPDPIGAVDFYPNGGTQQPGCRIKKRSVFDFFLTSKRKLESAICSHGRSYQYFIDAIRSDNCQFWGRLWDRSAKGMAITHGKLCDAHSCVPMGVETPNYPGTGCFYVATNDRTPYCFKDPTTEHTMKQWNLVSQLFNFTSFLQESFTFK